jgi:IS5 family transposase
MNAYIGVNPDSGLTYTLVATAANTGEITQAHPMLHGDKTTAFGDAVYQGVEKRQENENSSVGWHVARRPGKRCELPDTETGWLREPLEKLKPGARAKVEQPFHVVESSLGTTMRAITDWPRARRSCIGSSAWRI